MQPENFEIEIDEDIYVLRVVRTPTEYKQMCSNTTWCANKLNRGDELLRKYHSSYFITKNGKKHIGLNLYMRKPYTILPCEFVDPDHNIIEKEDFIKQFPHFYKIIKKISFEEGIKSKDYLRMILHKVVEPQDEEFENIVTKLNNEEIQIIKNREKRIEREYGFSNFYGLPVKTRTFMRL